MRIEKNQPSFGKILRDPDLPVQLYKQIVKTPPVKKFSRRYNATLSVEKCYSSKEPLKQYYGLFLYDITSKNIFQSIKRALLGETPHQTIVFKTHSQSKEELVKDLLKEKSNSIVKLYKKIF